MKDTEKPERHLVLHNDIRQIPQLAAHPGAAALALAGVFVYQIGMGFAIVFGISLLSLVAQGMSLLPVAGLLNLSYEEDPEVETYGLELPEEMGLLRDHTVCGEELANGATLRELHLPHGIRVVMVRRDGKFLVPHGSMKLFEGDHLLIMMGETDD